MSFGSTLNRLRAGQTVSADEHDALKRRVMRLNKALDEVVVREARLREELALLRRELVAVRDAPGSS